MCPAETKGPRLETDILATCDIETLLCVAVEFTLPEEDLWTRRVAEWRALPAPAVRKRSAVLLLGR